MKTIVNFSSLIVGKINTFTIVDVSNWDDIIGEITISACDFTIDYDGMTYEGSIAKTPDELSLLVAFDDDAIALPQGMCMEVTCDEEVEELLDTCFDTQIVPIDGTTRLRVVDNDGCPIGFVSVINLSGRIRALIDIPQNLCELLGVTEIPQGNLLASDRILTTSGGCTLKSVPASDVVCN